MMDPKASQESLGLAQNSTTCPYEEKVITDPTTARIVLTFLRDFVEQRMVYAQNPQGYYCPMTKCSSFFTEPLLLIQHLFTCPELGKGEFECWKCCSWHRFPTSEKEWADWTGWKSTTAGFQRKRSLGSKMKETLTETLALRRRNSGRKISISSTGGPIDTSQTQASMISAAAAMIPPATAAAVAAVASTASEMNGIVSSGHQPTQYRPPSDLCDWHHLLGLNPSQILSPRGLQELQTNFGIDQNMSAFASTDSNNNSMAATSGPSNSPGYACTFGEACYAADHHHHHHHHSHNHELDVKAEPGAEVAAIAAACSCNHLDGSSATSIAMDDGSSTMMWSTDVASSDISNLSSTRPSTTFERNSTLTSSTNPSQGSLFVGQNLSSFTPDANHLLVAGMDSGTSRSLAPDIGAMRSPHLTTTTALIDGRGTSAFSPMSPLRNDDRLTLPDSYASTPASGDLEPSETSIDERHNWYRHGQNSAEVAILAPVSTEGGLDSLSHVALVPTTTLTTTAAASNSLQQTSTNLEDMAARMHHHHHHHRHHTQPSPDAISTASMDVDMDGMPDQTHQSQPQHAGQPIPSYVQSPTSLRQGILPAHNQQQHYHDTPSHQLNQQQARTVVQEPTPHMNSVALQGGLFATTASMASELAAHAATPRYGFVGDTLTQATNNNKPQQHHHHHHPDLTSSSRSSLQPPKTPTSTIDDDIDPDDLICELCNWKPRGVRENLRGYLRKHKNVHKGLRLSCDIPGCKKSFSRLDNLKTHRREKHGIDDTVPVSKATSTTSVDSAGIMPSHQVTANGHGLLPIKRTMTMAEYSNDHLNAMMAISGMPTTAISTQPQHVLQAAATIAQAQAQAQAQVRQAQFQVQAQVQAQAQARAQFVQAQMQARAQVQAQAQAQARVAQVQAQVQAQATHSHAEPVRPDSKRQRESFDHSSYRGVSNEHAALWPAMQL